MIYLTPRQQDAYTLIKQSILDEQGGNVRNAFEDACVRLSILCEGVSWGAIRVPQGESLNAPKPRVEALDIDTSEAPHG
jgi:hypothetical protein